MAFNYTRYGSYIGSTVNLKAVQSTKTGVHQHNAYIPALFQMHVLKFISPIRGIYGPTTQQVRTNISTPTSTVTDVSFAENPNFFNVSGGIIQFTIPETAKYIILAEGAGHDSDNTGNGHGGGARIRASFNLEIGKFLWILIGQSNELGTSQIAWSGGAGGTFVTYGNSFGTSVPLVIAGGGGFLRSGTTSFTYNGKVPDDHINGQLSTESGEGYNQLGSNFGQRGLGVHNFSTGGTAAGWSQDGSTHTDLRQVPNSFTFNGVTYNYDGSYEEAKSFYNGGAGGQFRNVNRTNWFGDGGFGSGGPAGWGGEGGGGGYSGGANGNNSSNSFSGGGGSFIYYDIADINDLATSTGTWTRVGSISSHPFQPLGTYSSGIGNLGGYRQTNGSVSLTKA